MIKEDRTFIFINNQVILSNDESLRVFKFSALRVHCYTITSFTLINSLHLLLNRRSIAAFFLQGERWDLSFIKWMFNAWTAAHELYRTAKWVCLCNALCSFWWYLSTIDGWLILSFNLLVLLSCCPIQVFEWDRSALITNSLRSCFLRNLAFESLHFSSWSTTIKANVALLLVHDHIALAPTW